MPFLKPFGGPESVSYASLTISLVTAAYQMRIGFDQTDMRRFANTLLKNILNEDRTRIKGNVAGKGKEEDNLSGLYNFLPLAEGDSRVYQALRETYMNWEGQQVRYCAGLLKWEN